MGSSNLGHRLAQGSAAFTRKTHIMRSVVAALVALVIGLCLAMPGSASAQAEPEPGGGDYLHDMMLAWRLGSFYFQREEYEMALGYLQEAADLLPVEVLKVAPGYAEIYLLLGHTQQALGMDEAAQVNFALFVRYLPEESYRVDAGIVEG